MSSLATIFYFHTHPILKNLVYDIYLSFNHHIRNKNNLLGNPKLVFYSEYCGEKHDCNSIIYNENTIGLIPSEIYINIRVTNKYHNSSLPVLTA